MIPEVSPMAAGDLEIKKQPTYTYKLNTAEEAVTGYTDRLEAMKQAIYKILSTERYGYLIYSDNYGVELEDLYGEDISYVCPELERRITEALMQDDRIESVEGFGFDLSKKGVVSVKFTVNTVFGKIQAGKEVSI